MRKHHRGPVALVAAAGLFAAWVLWNGWTTGPLARGATAPLALVRVTPLVVEAGRANTVELVYRGTIAEAGRPRVAVEWEVFAEGPAGAATERAPLSLVGANQWSAAVPLDLRAWPAATRVVGHALAYVETDEPGAKALSDLTDFELRAAHATSQPTER